MEILIDSSKEISFTQTEKENEKVFKYDYKNPNDKIEFKKWKKSMINNYGKDIKVLKCLKDKILFFTKTTDVDNYRYLAQCPICKRNICYYCSYNINYNFIEEKYCCFNRAKFTYIDNASEYSKVNQDIGVDYFLVLIPWINFLFIIMSFIQFIFFIGIKRNGNLKGMFFMKNYIGRSIVVLISIILSIPLIFINIYFILIMIIISIPYKFYPLKYIIGLLLA